ncbi:hypothetical protein PFLUV_G00025680 [Perca fluviatilis]|uniref:RING-type domain-containing protein n=1 Tax=Perca fluviatilis TaxID=8168 RepID=A0A6A5FPZ3_PERFL|nr:uncharacterized protein LOC120553532 [Perca fluviatilis]KAF1394354.1 hypothetical protein PFLUV_G00025680 [Perca fluviatilis]
MMQRNVLIADVVDGRPQTSRAVTVNFSDFEASVPAITAKVVEALGQEETVVLIDNHGNQIVDCEGTRGSAFWKQHARKVSAVPEAQFELLRNNKRRRESRNEDTHDELRENLEVVSSTLKNLTKFIQDNPVTPPLSRRQIDIIKNAFTCIICTDLMKDPVFAECCRSLLGCRGCVDQWKQNQGYCPKCRGPAFDVHGHSVVGLDEALAALQLLLT